MKIGLRLILILLKDAVAAYLIGCVGLSWLQQLRQKSERFGRMQPKEHRNDQTELETRRPIRVIRRYGGAPVRFPGKDSSLRLPHSIKRMRCPPSQRGDKTTHEETRQPHIVLEFLHSRSRLPECTQGGTAESEHMWVLRPFRAEFG